MTVTASVDLTAPRLARRMACWLYEGVLLFGVVWLAGYLFSTLTQSRHALQNRHELQVFLFLVLAVYFVWFWSRGQTLAMKTWRIRVVGADGRPLPQKRALLRYLLAWVWFLPPLLMYALAGLKGLSALLVLLLWVALWALASHWHPQRQFWHDAWAGSRLVNAP